MFEVLCLIGSWYWSCCWFGVGSCVWCFACSWSCPSYCSCYCVWDEFVLGRVFGTMIVMGIVFGLVIRSVICIVVDCAIDGVFGCFLVPCVLILLLESFLVLLSDRHDRYQ